MHIECRQEIYYSNKNHLQIGEVASALVALEKSAAALPCFLENLYEGLIVKDVTLFVEDLRSGSLSEKIRYFVNFAFQKHVESQSGIPLGPLEGSPEEKKDQILAWAAVALLTIGIKLAYDKVANKPESHNINQQVNLSLEHGSKITGIEVNIIQSALVNAISANPESIIGAIEFIKPAKKDSEASIKFLNQTEFSKEFIAESPSGIPEVEVKEKTIELSHAEIHIRATDRDSGKKGWGATIPEFSDRRLKLSVAPGVDLDFLAHHDIVVGNVTIFYTVDDSGNITKPHAHLFSINKEESKQWQRTP